MHTYCSISDFDSQELGEMELLYPLAKGHGFFFAVSVVNMDFFQTNV